MSILTLASDGENIYAGMNAGGVWKFPVSGLVSVDHQAEINNSLVDLRNFPNPFNRNTNIIFNLPQDSYVTLSIYNVKGKVVKTILNEQKVAGEYNMGWKR